MYAIYKGNTWIHRVPSLREAQNAIKILKKYHNGITLHIRNENVETYEERGQRRIRENRNNNIKELLNYE